MTAEDIQYILRQANIWEGITQNIICFVCTKWCPELLSAIKLLSNNEGIILPIVIAGDDRRSLFQIEFMNRNIMEIVIIFILLLAMIAVGIEAMLIPLVILIFMLTKVADS